EAELRRRRDARALQLFLERCRVGERAQLIDRLRLQVDDHEARVVDAAVDRVAENARVLARAGVRVEAALPRREVGDLVANDDTRERLFASLVLDRRDL